MREHELQTAAAQFLALVLPSTALHTAIDAANKTSAIAGANFKRRGGIAGFPDHVIAYGGKVITIEFKAAKGRLSPEQIDDALIAKAVGEAAAHAV